MDHQQSIFNMIDEMNSVILTLQTEMFKVMNGINQLNLIITKIKQYRENNININMMNNNMMNNMMNNMINNINNNMKNINMGMDNMMGMQGMNMQIPMNGMMNNMNINMQNDIEDKINLIFEDYDDGETSKINIQISNQKLVQEAINMYLLRTGKNIDGFNFIFNNQKLCPEEKICESGLSDKSIIKVIREGNFIG